MNKLLHCYKAKNKDENILNASQSGGMYSIIANQFIENEGIVYACIMNSSGDILHNRLTSKKEVEKGRGSKYVQSKLNDLEAENASLRGQISQAEQNAYLVNALGAKVPQAAYIVANPYTGTAYSGCGC